MVIFDPLTRQVSPDRSMRTQIADGVIQVVHKLKITNASIRQIAFDSSGQYVLPLPRTSLLTCHSNMVISSTDRAIRTFQVSPLTGGLNPIHRFQDSVNRTPWHAVGFSGDGEYVVGGAGHKMAHNVFVWDRDSGVLVKVLEGPKEPLIHCDVRPHPSVFHVNVD